MCSPVLCSPVFAVFVCPSRRSIHSIACESYFIVRPEGNVMVDTPRFNPALAKRLQEMGGVKYIFLTHKVSDTHIWSLPPHTMLPLPLPRGSEKLHESC